MRRRKIAVPLIEPLVIAALILVLAAVAFPALSAHRVQGFNERAAADLRHLAQAQEQYFRANQAYTSNLSQLEGFTKSPDVNIQVSEVTATSFKALALHRHGDQTMEWDSRVDALQ